MRHDCARIVLHLHVTHSDTIPAWLGRVMQAIYLRAVQRISPELSSAVHDGTGYHPYTVSDVLPVVRTDVRDLKCGQRLTVILTTLHPEVTALTLNAVVPMWIDEGLDVHGQMMRVDGTEIHATTYQQLLQTAATQTDRYIQMNFITPTSMKKSRPPTTHGERRESAVLPLPNPDRVFLSLYERWNYFSSIKLPDKLRDYLSHEILLHYCNIHTRYMDRTHANRGSTVGFLGDVTFYCDSLQQPHFGYAHALAAFAPYSGVGIKTTQGMGTVQVVPRRGLHDC